MEFGKFFPIFGDKVTPGFPKFHCACLTNVLGRNNFVGKAHKLFIISGIRAKCFQNFDKKFFDRVVTTGFCVSRWRFFFYFFEGMNWRRELLSSKKIALLSFWDFERKIFSTFAGMVTQACQKIVVHVQTKIFTKKIFAELIIFSSFPEI